MDGFFGAGLQEGTAWSLMFFFSSDGKYVTKQNSFNCSSEILPFCAL